MNRIANWARKNFEEAPDWVVVLYVITAGLCVVNGVLGLLAWIF